MIAEMNSFFSIKQRPSFLLIISFLSLSCFNPFAPKIDTELSSGTCSDFKIIENMFCAFRNAYAFKDTSLYGSLIDPDFTFSYRDYDHGVNVLFLKTEQGI